MKKTNDKTEKAIIHIDKTLTSIHDMFNDLNMKLCHIIKERKHFLNMSSGNYFES